MTDFVLEGATASRPIRTSTQRDNYSAIGNVNPYTGAAP